MSQPNDAGALDNFPGNRALFKFKQKITSKTGNSTTDAKTIKICTIEVFK